MSTSTSTARSCSRMRASWAWKASCPSRDFPYRSGRTTFWLKIKNPDSPAMLQLEDGTW
jgi:hypothetical protein